MADKKNLHKKLFALLFLVIIAVLMALVLAGFWKAYSDRYDAKNYNKEKTFFGRVVYVTKKIADNFDDTGFDYYAKKVPFYQKTVLLNKTFDKAVGKNATTSLSGTLNDPENLEDIVLELSDGYLGLPLDVERVKYTAAIVGKFGKELRKRGVNFLYVDVPHKINTEDPVFKKYRGVYPDYSDSCSKDIVEVLRQSDIDILSIAQCYPDMQQNPYSYFFKTDHHWLPQSGLLATTALAEKLNNDYGYSIDTSTFDLGNYNISYYPMLGSLGKKVTEVYCDIEELPVIIPKFETDFSVTLLNGQARSGKIEDSLFDFSVFEQKDIYKANPYGVYALGNRSLISVHNNLVHNGKRILVIKDSMANVMTPYLACVVEDLDIIDIRAYKKSIYKYIEETKPDTVILIYGTHEFAELNAFMFR